MESFKRVFVVLVAVVGFQTFAADPLDTWHWRMPSPGVNQLRSVVWGADRYVAVGENGSAVFSPNGKDWFPSASGTAFDLVSVAFGNGKFVAVGELGELLISSDGKAWLPQASGTFANLHAIAFGSDRWVAVGDFGTIVTSTNAIDWLTAASGGATWRDIAWGNGSFLAVGGTMKYANGQNGEGSPQAALSSNGTLWRAFDPTLGSAVWFKSCSFGNGRFLISTSLGNVLTSTDLTRWSSAQTTAWTGFTKMAYGNGEYLGFPAANSFLGTAPFRSIDGAFWNQEPAEQGLQVLSGAAFGGQGWVLVGGLESWSAPSIIHSAASGGWRSRLKINPFLFGPVRRSGDWFFASAAYDPNQKGLSLWRSLDGIEWLFKPNANSGEWSLPSFGKGIYVTAGPAGLLGISTNGADWAVTQTPTTNHLRQVEFANELFVAVGDRGTVLTSTNGTNWNRQSAPTDTRLTTVVWNAGRWVASGPDATAEPARDPLEQVQHPAGAALISSDAILWQTTRTNGFAQILPFKTGFFTSAGLKSENGEVWSTVRTNADQNVGWLALGSSGDELLGAQFDGRSPSPGLLSSDDGTNWTPHLVPFPMAPTHAGVYLFGGVAFGRGTWLVSHGSGALIQSDPVKPSPPTLASVPIRITGGPGDTGLVRVQASGSSPLLYQWSRNGISIAGETNQFLMIEASDSPTNRFRVTVSNAFGSTNSADVAITAPARPELKLVRQNSNWLEVKGTPGRRYVAEQSGNLGSSTNWTSIGLVEIDCDFPAYLSVDLPADTNRFFRAVAEP